MPSDGPLLYNRKKHEVQVLNKKQEPPPLCKRELEVSSKPSQDRNNFPSSHAVLQAWFSGVVARGKGTTGLRQDRLKEGID